jgi:hypothetical protein
MTQAKPKKLDIFSFFALLFSVTQFPPSSIRRDRHDSAEQDGAKT